MMADEQGGAPARPGYFISTTIPYVNGPPHLGMVLEYIQSDAFARWHRDRGDDVLFLTGSDENSLKNVLAAEREGVTTAELVGRNTERFQQITELFDISVDYFIRTSLDPLHAAGATKMWQRLAASGDIYVQRYQGLYCVGCEQFYTEDELVDGLCREHHTRPEMVEEENHFFRLSLYAQPVIQAIESGAMRILPEGRRNEVLAFLRGEVRDISISRSRERAHGWGIPVPGDDSQVMYVWIDALTNYVNALDYAAEGERYQRYWVNAGERVHMLGKGVIRFHAVYWPAMLLSAGVPLPTTLYVHEYITMDGQKVSKSLGGLDPVAIVDRFGADAVRHFLLAEMPLRGDLDYSSQRLVDRYNTDLANGLGNLLNRTVSMIHRYRGGTIPDPDAETDLEADVRDTAERTHAAVAAAMERYDHRTAVESLWELVRRGNRYIEEAAPWKLAANASAEPSSAQRLDTVLHTTAETLRHIAVDLQPFIPTTAARIIDQLTSAPERDGDVRASGSRRWGTVLAGSPVGSPQPMFPRIKDDDGSTH